MVISPRARTAWLTTAVAVATSVAGCATDESASPSTTPPATTMSVHRAQHLMDTFDRRMHAAAARAVSPRHDASGWSDVAVYEQLATARYQTWIFRAADDRRPAPTTRHTVRKIVADVHRARQHILVLEGSEVFRQPAGGDAKKLTHRSRTLWVMERRAHGRWRLADDFSMDADRPAPPTGSSSAAPTGHPPLDHIVAAVIDGLEVGDDHIAGSSRLHAVRKHTRVARDIDPNFSCYPRSTRPKTRKAAERP